MQRLPAKRNRPQRCPARRRSAALRRACARAAAPGCGSGCAGPCAAAPRRATRRGRLSTTRYSAMASLPRGSRGCVSFWISAFVSHTSVSRHVPSGWRGLAVDDGEVDPLGLTPGKLRLQPLLRGRILGKHDEARRVLVDAVDDERAALAVRAEALLDLVVDGRHVRVALERNREDARRLADDQQRVVFVDDVEVARGPGARPRLRAAGRSTQTRTTSPATSRRAASAMSASSSLTKILPRSSAATAFPLEPSRSARREELVETDAAVSVAGDPTQVGSGHAPVRRDLQRCLRTLRRRSVAGGLWGRSTDARVASICFVNRRHSSSAT